MSLFEFIGNELYFDPTLGRLEKQYCKLLGVPITGLRVRLRKLSKILPEQATFVLDAGCGRGVISRFLARKYSNAKVDAVDFDANRQIVNGEIASQTELSNIGFVSGDLMTYKKPNHYDLIVSVDNLEHVEDDEQVLRNFFESLQDNGVLVVHVPHYYRRWPLFHWTVNFEVPGHVRPGYHLPELTERLTRAGFTIIKSGFSYGFLENLANNLSYAITQAKEKNKIIYAISFPILNFIAWLGQWGQPKAGAAVWVVARKLNDVNLAEAAGD